MPKAGISSKECRKISENEGGGRSGSGRPTKSRVSIGQPPPVAVKQSVARKRVRIACDCFAVGVRRVEYYLAFLTGRFGGNG